jgi:selenium metabolism protein YedF
MFDLKGDKRHIFNRLSKHKEQYMEIIDCRNLHCPGPVLKAKKSLQESGGKPVKILVDAGASRENVTRFAQGKGYSVHEEAVDGGFALTISAGSPLPLLARATAEADAAVVLVASDKFGNGPDQLGQLLMKNFLISLLEANEPPEKLFFINSGVLLTVTGAETVEPLAKLAEAGVEIMSCGVCLDFFAVRDKLAVGGITNMLTITESLLQGKIVIRL